MTKEELTKLSPEEMLRAIAWIQENCGSNPCPLCQTQSWSLSDRLGGIPVVSKKALHLGQYMPVVIAICAKCGHIIQFSAYAVGVGGFEEVAKKEVSNAG